MVVFYTRRGHNLIMEVAIQTELDKLKDLIVNAIPVEQIYLFGSHAYGNPQKDSDLDLYVVLKDDVQMRDLDAGLQIRFAIARNQNMEGDLSVAGIWLLQCLQPQLLLLFFIVTQR